MVRSFCPHGIRVYHPSGTWMCSLTQNPSEPLYLEFWGRFPYVSVVDVVIAMGGESSPQPLLSLEVKEG